MKLYKRYILLIFFIENLLVSSSLSVGKWPFYIILSLGFLLLPSKEIWSAKSMKECKTLYLLSFVYIAYQFTLGFNTLNLQTSIYLLAKIVTFVIIVISLENDWDFYANRLPKIISITIFVVLLTGVSSGVDVASLERQKMGFGNVNLTGSLASICFAGAWFFRKKIRPIFAVLMHIVSLFALLISGSRNAILYVAVFMLVWSGLKVNKVLGIVFVLGTLYFVYPMLPFQFAGVERVHGTLDGSVSLQRDVEREATIMMIRESPITGWGFEAQNVGAAAEVSELGSHNGYLDTIKFMGYPFGILWFVVLFVGVIPLLKYIKSKDEVLQYHLAIVLSTIATAFFEGWFTGVHQFNTNVMYYSLAVLSIYYSRTKRKQIIKFL